MSSVTSPVRRRVQRRVDRRFNRARYDADQIVAVFAAQLKDAVDLDAVCEDLARVIQVALEPAHVKPLGRRPPPPGDLAALHHRSSPRRSFTSQDTWSRPCRTVTWLPCLTTWSAQSHTRT